MPAKAASFKKILSIDGGGIKGVFPASFLSTVEDSIKGKVSDHFDLIVGTSTGGIIALALGLGFSAKEILEFYEQYGPKIFKGNKFLSFIRQLGYAKYEHKDLKLALINTFGDKKIGQSKNRLVIPSLNLETG
ncbi:MAG TPA: patatin-like phospholipase family protein, partial [Patescibacteria group bacterium]|nr:patatin-like phospholipase family protein [Patescibacteria group bacterium]